MKLFPVPLIAILASLLADPVPVLAGTPTHARIIPGSHGTSPSGKILWAFRRINEEGHDHWKCLLSQNEDPHEQVPLCDDPGSISISPDDQWIIIGNDFGTRGGYLRLFKHIEGAHYEEKKLDLLKNVQQAFAQTPEGKTVHFQHLDHATVRCQGWSSDSKVASVEYEGVGPYPGKNKPLEVHTFACSLAPEPLHVTAGAPAAVVTTPIAPRPKLPLGAR